MPGERKFDLALDYLGEAKQAAERTRFPQTKPEWYTSTFQIAAAYDYLDELKQAEETARQAVDRAEEVLGKLSAEVTRAQRHGRRQPWEPYFWERWFRPRRARLKQAEGRALRDFLESFRPLVLILYAAILVRLNPTDKVGQEAKAEAQRKVSDIAKSKPPTALVSYDLACYYSRVGEVQERDEEKRASYRRALLQLENTFEEGGEFYAKAACDDPSLRGVREYEHTERDFRKLIEKYGDATKDDPAEKLPAVGLIRRLIDKYMTTMKRNPTDQPSALHTVSSIQTLCDGPFSDLLGLIICRG